MKKRARAATDPTHSAKANKGSIARKAPPVLARELSLFTMPEAPNSPSALNREYSEESLYTMADSPEPPSEQPISKFRIARQDSISSFAYDFEDMEGPPPKSAAGKGEMKANVMKKKGRVPEQPPAPPSPPPPPPPPPTPPLPRQTKADVNTNYNLTNLTAADLLEGKKHLRKTNIKLREVSLDKNFLFQDLKVKQYIPLAAAKDFLQTQSKTVDVVTLNLCGVEQVNDAFLYTMLNCRVDFPNMKELLLSGCHYITDEGVKWLTLTFKNLQRIAFSGCRKLTERSLIYLYKSPQQLRELNMSGTNIAIIPPSKYTGVLKLLGCPLLSPTHSVYNEPKNIGAGDNRGRSLNRKWELKIVVVTPDSGLLPWSPFAVMTNEKEVAAKNKLSIKTNCSIVDKVKSNLFEVPENSGFLDLVLTNGSIVVLPYRLMEGGVTETVISRLTEQLYRVFVKCPETVFILLGLSDKKGLKDITVNKMKEVHIKTDNIPDIEKVHKEKEEADQKLLESMGIAKETVDEDKAEEIQDMEASKLPVAEEEGTVLFAVKQKLKEKLSALGDALCDCLRTNYRLDQMNFHEQEIFSAGEKYYHQGKRLFGTTEYITNININASTLVVGEQATKSTLKFIKEAAGAQFSGFQWYRLRIQDELKNVTQILQEIEFLPAPLRKVCDEYVSSSVKGIFTTQDPYPFIGRTYQLLTLWGRAMMYTNMKEQPILTDFKFLEMLYEKLVISPAPQNLPVRCLGGTVPAWRDKDLEAIFPSGTDKSVVSLMTKVLCKQGCLVKFPKDPFTAEVDTTWLYVVPKFLSEEAPITLENYWPTALPDDEVQKDKFYTFMPEIPQNFFVSLIQDVIKLGGVTVLWKTGMLLHKGPVTVLIELLQTEKGCPVIVLSTRVPKAGSEVSKAGKKYLWSTLMIYASLIKTLIVEYKAYATESTACVGCQPNRDRFKVLSSDKCSMFIDSLVRGTGTRPHKCPNDGTQATIEHCLGPIKDLEPVLPDWRSNFATTRREFSRCCFCQHCSVEGPQCQGNLQNGASSWHCNCERTGQIYSNGVCVDCSSRLLKMQTTLWPYFRPSGEGSLLNLQPAISNLQEGPIKLTETMDPIKARRIDVTFIRGSAVLMSLMLYDTAEFLMFSAHEGLVKEKNKDGEEKIVLDVGWKCKEGDTVSFLVHHDTFDRKQMTVDLQWRGKTLYSVNKPTTLCYLEIKGINPVCVCVTMPGRFVDSIPSAPPLPADWKKGAARVGGDGGGVYLSHVQGDRYQKSVDKIKASLKEAGFAVCAEGTKDAHGAELIDRKKTVDQAAVVLVCMSQNLAENDICREECQYAMSKNKPIVAVRMQAKYEPFGWLGMMNGTMLNFDFSTDFDSALQKLLQEFDKPKYNISSASVKEVSQQNEDTEDEDHQLAHKSTFLHPGLEAQMIKFKPKLEEILFQAGGVNYSGSAMAVLPSTVNKESLRYPSFQSIKSPRYLPLCYTRTKISDMQTTNLTAEIPDSWAIYRMVHFLDAEGVSNPVDWADSPYLLWAWHLLLLWQSQIQLPRNTFRLFPADILAEMTPAVTHAVIHDMLRMSFWKLCLYISEGDIVSRFMEQLVEEAEVLRQVTVSDLEVSGLCRVVSKFNEANVLYLCPGHKSSMMVEEGMVEVMPEIYGNYSKFLASVDLPSNSLTELPAHMFEALPNLMEFDCQNNFLEYLPDTIGKCKLLRSLSLADNNLRTVPDSLLECHKLERLEISSNMMDAVPAVVTKLTSLKRLYCSHMMLTELPDDIGNLEELDKMYINGNCFRSLPESFRKLKNLSDLGMSGIPWCSTRTNKMMSYENFVTFLKSRKMDRWLEAHDEDRNELFKYFDEDSNGTLDVKELGKLNAAIFNIFPRFGYKSADPPEDDTPSGFPEQILDCSNLQYLNMYYHGLVSLPKEIGDKLQNLKVLNLSHNPNLLSIPAELAKISTLTRIELDECPLLKTPPKEIRDKGFATTFAYLTRLMSGSVSCKRTKLMMVGLGEAGKTSLVRAMLSKDKRAEMAKGEAITDGIDICNWVVNADGEKVTYSVWDFAGQTVYYNTHQFFLSNRAVYLLLWNVRLGYEHAGLDFWLSSISIQAPQAPIFVVGSHIDQVSKYELPLHEMKQRYSQIVGFHFVSSFTGEGIEGLQKQLFEVTLQQQYMGEKIPAVWLTFENAITSARSNNHVIEYTALEKMANQSGIFDKSEVFQAVQFLHDLGSLQYFTNDYLKSKVVINPQWIVDVMACVVSVKNTCIEKGILHHKDISSVWQEYPESLHSWLLRLTEEFDLTFQLEGQKINLVPCMLPEKRPDFTWPELERDSAMKESKMIYKFDYLPAGLFNRGQVRLHQFSDSALIWKKGSFLKKNGHVALIEQFRDCELIVTVQGPRPENVLFLVHEVFEGLISESFRGVHYDYLMPCPDCARLIVKDPHMFAASTIRRAVELKAPFLQCIKYFHTISCVDLLTYMPPDSHSDFDLHLVQTVRGLKDLKRDIAADVFMSYCGKDAPRDTKSVIHPATVHTDLAKSGYKCWFAGDTNKFTTDEMARALIDSSVFIAFVSSDYVKDDDCVNIFKYARLTLKKKMVVVAVGDGFDWKQSRLGILLADEVFVNMTKPKVSHYQSKFEELLNALNEKTNRNVRDLVTPPCFFSYTWVNSAEAVALGTREVPGAIGFGDPRKMKKYLEEHGVRCWIDVERVGVNGLFEDIAEGLINAKVVVVCVSDEYASSPTCRMEFRYAANTLKLPVVMAVVGRGSKWRASEVGVLSLNYPLVSFQEKSDSAHEKLLELVNEQLNVSERESVKDKKNRANEQQKNLSFQELFELAQRKFLRQISTYAEHQDLENFPRLFIVDFIPEVEEEKKDKGNNENPDTTHKGETSEEKPLRPKTGLKRRLTEEASGMLKKLSDLKTLFRMQNFCVHMLCEHEEGWHSVADPLPLSEDFGQVWLEKFSPYLARVTAIMKYNKKLILHCMEGEEGHQYTKWLEESPQAAVSDFQQIYHDFRQMVIDADEQKTFGKLARCHLPNGRTIWLCEKHRSSMRVTVLSNEVVTGHHTTADSDTTNFMIAGLREIDHAKFRDKFKSTRKSKKKFEGPPPGKRNKQANTGKTAVPTDILAIPNNVQSPQQANQSASLQQSTNQTQSQLSTNDDTIQTTNQKEEKQSVRANEREDNKETMKPIAAPVATKKKREEENTNTKIETVGMNKFEADKISRNQASSLIQNQASPVTKSQDAEVGTSRKSSLSAASTSSKASTSKTGTTGATRKASKSGAKQQPELEGRQKSKACTIM